jgi:hypothetical protein
MGRYGNKQRMGEYDLLACDFLNLVLETPSMASWIFQGGSREPQKSIRFKLSASHERLSLGPLVKPR